MTPKSILAADEQILDEGTVSDFAGLPNTENPTVRGNGNPLSGPVILTAVKPIQQQLVVITLTEDSDDDALAGAAIQISASK